MAIVIKSFSFILFGCALLFMSIPIGFSVSSLSDNANIGGLIYHLNLALSGFICITGFRISEREKRLDIEPQLCIAIILGILIGISGAICSLSPVSRPWTVPILAILLLLTCLVYRKICRCEKRGESFIECPRG